MVEVFREALRKQEASELRLRMFDEQWEEAHPKPPKEFCSWHPEVKYLALPGTYSGAEKEVLGKFGLLDEFPTPPRTSV